MNSYPPCTDRLALKFAREHKWSQRATPCGFRVQHSGRAHSRIVSNSQVSPAMHGIDTRNS